MGKERGGGGLLSVERGSLFQGPHCTWETGKITKKNTGDLEILQKHREFGLLKL